MTTEQSEQATTTASPILIESTTGIVTAIEPPANPPVEVMPVAAAAEEGEDSGISKRIPIPEPKKMVVRVFCPSIGTQNTN